MADDPIIPEPDRIDDAPHPRQSVHLFGQNGPEQDFIEAFHTGRMHHAWLLTGARGVGKATLAWRIARHLLAATDDGFLAPSRPKNLDMHPDDPVFRRVAALGEPRLVLCRRPWNEKTKKLSSQITVDEVRKLKSFFTLSAADGGWRVAIADSADDMNTAAANALLKILEEPPEKTAILLVSHQPGRLLPTIRSRCRTLALAPLSPNDLGLALDAAGQEIPPDITQLHQLAEGAPGQALEMVLSGGDELYAQIVDTIGTCPQLDRGKALALADACSGRGAETRYQLTIRLMHFALARLAKSAVTDGGLTEATGGESALHARLAPGPDAARRWAELEQTLSARTAHAVAVNLDPSHVILDTFLQIDAVAAKTTA